MSTHIRYVAYTPDDRTKLDGIEVGAEANNISDANALDLTDGGETTLHTHPSGGSLPSLDYTTDANIDGFDVSSIAPYGILYVNTASNRELRSLTGGVDDQLLVVCNIATSDLKIKHQTGTYQQIRVENAADKTIGDYGGTTLVYNATEGYWFTVGIIT